jgi:plastocyanin
MSRTLHIAAATATLATATSLLLPAAAPAAPALKTIHGSVGPGFTINLTLAGKKVTKLKAGMPYRFTINDRASIHDFHLTGPGLNRTLTSVDFTGTKTVVLKLRKGVYRYLCDPHASLMHGSFRVA